MSCLVKSSNIMSSALQKFFYRVGWIIGKYPWMLISVSLLLTFLSGCGLKFLKQENRPEKLWVSENSKNQEYSRNVLQNFKNQFYEEMIISSSDILTPASLNAMLTIDEAVKSVNVGKKWNDICYRVGTHCYVSSILEIWNFNRTVIDNLTRKDILKKVNALKDSRPATSHKGDVMSLLGGIRQGDDGKIVGAAAAAVTYGLKDNGFLDESVGKYIDAAARKWESEFISIGKSHYENINVSVYASTSLDRESLVAISSDLSLIIIGYGLLLVYIMMMLGKFSLVEHKFYVSLGGVLMVAMTCIVAVGVCAIGGFVYSVLNSILPFLLLGIGVDDMFVIVQAWENLTADEKARPVYEKSALALKHAGVSITVTSVTDMIAFAIGATTILPGLRSFCVYCGIGIGVLFIFNILFFESLLVLDARRIESKRDACICCYLHGDDYQSLRCAGRYRLQEFFEGIYARVLIKLPVKISIVVFTAALFGFGLWGTLKIEQKFDFRRFVQLDSYVTTYFDFREKFFPARGRSSAIYLSNVRLFEERAAITKLYADAHKNAYIDPLSFSSWYKDYELWLQSSKANDNDFDESMKWPRNEEIFFKWVHEFLDNSTIGRHYKTDVVFDEKTSKYISSRIRFKHIVLSDSADKVKAMDTIQNLVDEAEFRFDNDAFAFSKPYFFYETNKIIKKELWRNLGLASMCVLIVILLLLANANACVLVFFSVVLTLVDVAGFIHHWGLSIDTVVTVTLIVSIGIAVDYSAHIGHTFMTVTGTNNERTCKTLGNIGPAVFNGGFSTLLVFILLALSDSYVFQVFFKVFLLVVIFGLFHGLVLLPVLLSWIAPSPFPEYHEPTRPHSKENGKQSDNKAGVDNVAFDAEVCPPNSEYDEPTNPLSKEKEKQCDKSTEKGIDNVAFDAEVRSPKAEYHEPTKPLSKITAKLSDTKAGVNNVEFNADVCPPKADDEADGIVK